MNEKSMIIKAAVIQAAPLLFDKAATVEKACMLIKEAAGEGARLMLFPEAFIPAYPRGLSFGTVVGSRSADGRDLWLKYWQHATDVPGPETETLAKCCKKYNTFMGIGVIERDRVGGTLYCTLLYFGPEGTLLGKHRKLKPTAAERIIWGEGDGSTLTVVDTEIGKIGGLICWENYMPLARMAMYQQGTDFYLAPTADARETWTNSMIHVALEGRCFVLACNQFITKEMYPKDLPGIEDLKNQPHIMSNGGSMIVSPLGEVLAGPLRDKEGILYANLDTSDLIKSKLDFDVTGHYARPDVFKYAFGDQNPF
jgi:nitrilase